MAAGAELAPRGTGPITRVTRSTPGSYVLHDEDHIIAEALVMALYAGGHVASATAVVPPNDAVTLDVCLLPPLDPRQRPPVSAGCLTTGALVTVDVKTQRDDVAVRRVVRAAIEDLDAQLAELDALVRAAPKPVAVRAAFTAVGAPVAHAIAALRAERARRAKLRQVPVASTHQMPAAAAPATATTTTTTAATATTAIATSASVVRATAAACANW